MYPFAENITKEAVNELDLDHYKGDIVLVNTVEDAIEALNEISSFSHIGFDSESKPVFKKGGYNPIALLQFSTPEKTYLMRLNKIGLIDEMKQFFADSSIKKIGIGLIEDLRDLRRLGATKLEGFVHLNEVVKEINIESNGLRKLTAIILGFRVSKNAQVSNWEAPELTKKQLIYAATDSWVCLEMYQKLVNQELIDIIV